MQSNGRITSNSGLHQDGMNCEALLLQAGIGQVENCRVVEHGIYYLFVVLRSEKKGT